MSSGRFNRRNISTMSANFSFLPEITDRNSEQFLEDIVKLHENQYTPINHIPTIFGQKINLLTLYNAVAKRGGFKKMNTEQSWEGVLSDLKVPNKCVNASFALRNIFQRYLEPFEKIQRSKSSIKDIEEELQMETENPYKNVTQRATSTSSNFYPINMVYRADSHQIASHTRRDSGLSCDLCDVVEFKKLEMSLKCGLANETEFSLNTVLLMSFQTEGVQLCRNYRLLGLILNRVGVGNLETLKELSLQDHLMRRFLQFWNHTVTSEFGRKFLLPDIFDCDRYDTPKMKAPYRMLNLNDELTIYDKEGQRVQLVGTIIRNLALDTANCRPITQSHQCMRFIFLCCYASHYALRQLGLEILSMLSFPVVGILSETLSSFLPDLVNSEDRVERLKGLQLLIHLSDQKVSISNTNFICGLSKHFFSSLISMLIIHDLHIVALALEAVYALSEVDPSLCLKLVECSCHTLSTLYLLLNLEAQVMGTQSLIRIRVMQGPSLTNSGSEEAICQSQSSHKKLETSLMPPPPVPTHKVPTTAVLIPYTNSTKHQIHSCTEAQVTQSKIQIIESQPVGDNGDTLVPIHQRKVSIPSPAPFIIKNEPMTTYFSAPLTSGVVTSVPTVVKTVYTDNRTPNPINIANTTNPSFIQENHTCANESPSLSTCHSDPSSTTHKSAIVLANSQSNCTEKIIAIEQFIPKCEFVKTWLLDNYIGSPRGSASLFAMYKHLQAAIYKYFKGSEILTAEELHKLVRVLFPQVQLIQLQTSEGAAEVHYYNLVVSARASSQDPLIESHTYKISTVLSCAKDTTTQEAPSDPLSISSDQSIHKPLKRSVPDLGNGNHIVEEHENICPTKRARPFHDQGDQNERPIPNSKEEPINGNHINGLVQHQALSIQKTVSSTLEERHCGLHSNVQRNRINDGQSVDEWKHSDSETKTFSSSTVSPLQCESLANGTDGSSEETIDSEQSKVVVNVTCSGSQASIPSSPFVSNRLLHNSSENVLTAAVSSNSIEQSSSKRNVKKTNFNQLGRTRSRFRINNPSGKCKPRSSSSQRPQDLSNLYICQWDNCFQSFDKPQKVYGHVYTNHFMTLRTEVESKCFWSDCYDETWRTPLPLLNHVNEQHCNNIALESARQVRLAKEKENSSPNTLQENISVEETESVSRLLNFCAPQSSILSAPASYQEIPAPPLSTSGDTGGPSKPSITSSTSSLVNANHGIPPSQLLLAQPPTLSSSTSLRLQNSPPSSSTNATSQISSSENDLNPLPLDMLSQIRTSSSSIPPVITSPCWTGSSSAMSSEKHAYKEGPVTKHIRYLSALILRNLCRCSYEARRFVAARHGQIFEMSISGLESSTALSECLFYSSRDVGGDIH